MQKHLNLSTYRTLNLTIKSHLIPKMRFPGIERMPVWIEYIVSALVIALIIKYRLPKYHGTSAGPTAGFIRIYHQIEVYFETIVALLVISLTLRLFKVDLVNKSIVILLCLLIFPLLIYIALWFVYSYNISKNYDEGY